MAAERQGESGLQLRMQVSKEDLDKLLSMAEDLTDRADDAATQYKKARLFSEASFGAAFYVSAILVAVGILLPPAFYRIVLLLAGVGGFVICLILWRRWFESVSSLDLRRRRDQYAADEVVRLIREIEPVVAVQDKWSALERAEFRIRLSRFGITATGRSSPQPIVPIVPAGKRLMEFDEDE